MEYDGTHINYNNDTTNIYTSTKQQNVAKENTDHPANSKKEENTSAAKKTVKDTIITKSLLLTIYNSVFSLSKYKIGQLYRSQLQISNATNCVILPTTKDLNTSISHAIHLEHLNEGDATSVDKEINNESVNTLAINKILYDVPSTTDDQVPTNRKNNSHAKDIKYMATFSNHITTPSNTHATTTLNTGCEYTLEHGLDASHQTSQ